MTAILLHIAYLGAVGFCLCTVGWLMLRAERTNATKALMLCQMLIIIWCLPQLFLVFAFDVKLKYALYGISYIGISLIGPCWLEFSYAYCKRRILPAARYGIFAISAFDYGMFLTNRFHGLFYESFGLYEVAYGPVFYFHMAYSYTCVLTGIGAVLRSFQKNRINGGHVTVILLAACFPLAFNMLYLSGTVKVGFDLTPPVFALSSFLMLLAVFRYDFLDINVVASEHIFESIEEGVIVCNKRGNVTYCNKAAFRYAQVKNGDEYEKIHANLCRWAMPGQSTLLKAPDSAANGVVLELADGKKVRLVQYSLQGRRGEETAKVILLTDVGEYYELLKQSRELAVSEQRLAIERERNRIAQEVHDTTGHTLTMIQSLVRLIAVQCGNEEAFQDNRELSEYLNQAKELAAGGIRQLRWSINQMRRGLSLGLVTQGIRQLADSVKEMNIEVEIQGEDGENYSHLSPIVYRCVREAITNSLKYARASHMDIIVKFSDAGISLYMFDDGQGCASINEDHGLSGIRERVNEAGGQVRFMSAEGEGFQIYIELPAGDSHQ